MDFVKDHQNQWSGKQGKNWWKCNNKYRVKTENRQTAAIQSLLLLCMEGFTQNGKIGRKKKKEKETDDLIRAVFWNKTGKKNQFRKQ